jgi:hypothetical protein
MSATKLYWGLMTSSLVFLILIYLVGILMEIPYSTLTKEPSYIGGLHPFTGILSNFGILGWCVAAAVAVFTWQLLRDIPEKREMSHFLLYFGVLSVALLLDDFLLFHEWVFIVYFGIPESVTVGAYGVLTLFGLVFWRKTILNTSVYPLLIVALGFFALSVFIDFFYTITRQLFGEVRVVFEDGAKFIGIVNWLCYFVWVSLTEVKQLMR